MPSAIYQKFDKLLIHVNVFSKYSPQHAQLNRSETDLLKTVASSVACSPRFVFSDHTPSPWCSVGIRLSDIFTFIG